MRDRGEAVILVTGATDGLGRRVALDLASEGARVLLHGRSEERTEAALREISEKTGSDRLEYYLADFSSLSEVRAMADRIRADHDRLDVLVNNAGVIFQRREESEDGVERSFAVNHLAAFLLTRLLLSLLRNSAPARIVNVASAAQSPIDFDDVMLKRNYEPMRAYAQSKLAMVMDTLDLAEDLEGTGVSVNALHPASLMDTRMVRENFGAAASSIQEGAEATERLAVSPDLEGVTGRYFDGKRQVRANAQAYDGEARQSLRRLSEDLTGLGRTRY